MTDFEDVGRFHRKFGLPSALDGPPPSEIDGETRDFRLGFLLEEIRELCEGYGLRLSWEIVPETAACPDCGGDGCDNCANGAVAVEPNQDLPKVADALVDLVYVALGTAHLHRLPWPKLFAEVQHANMSKERAAPDGSDSVRGSALDVVKPEGWRPPNVGLVLGAAGWERK